MSDKNQPELIKMADLARQSGVPAPTIKHYIREGLLPPPAKRTSRNMAYYDAAIVPRIRTIKELQRTRFLPLRVIKELLDGSGPGAGIDPEAAITRVLQDMAPSRSKTRNELIEEGMPASELDWFQDLGIVSPTGQGEDQSYVGDDLELVETLNEARLAGITRDMLPPTILEPYVRSIHELVRTEVRMFREGVVPVAGDNLPALAEAATVLSERLVVLLRRKMLVPTLREVLSEEANVERRAPRAKPKTTKTAKPTKKAAPRRKPAPR
jgi:DNA-binding transcriptional MerR regulator